MDAAAAVTALTRPCLYAAVTGIPCETPAAFASPDRQFCRPHYQKLYKTGKLPPRARTPATGKAVPPAPLPPKPHGDPAFAQTVKQRLETAAETYLNFHLRAAEVAAEKGDGRPAEWALVHSRAITPIEKQDGGPRVAVTVGVVLPGLGLEASPAITVQAVPALPGRGDPPDAA